jgi:hypothetical protein
MITEIGIAAGEIWNHLELKGRTAFDEILTIEPRKEKIMLMALGWLAREGHVLFKNENGAFFIELSRKVDSHV